MSKKYAKLISPHQISYPPKVKGNVSNYHLCEDLLIADGYKILDDSHPLPDNGTYLPFFEEIDGKIVRTWQKQAVPEVTYAEKRAAEYPPVEEYLDAQVKLNSGNPELVAAGQVQLDAYYNTCLQIKAKYPKPQNKEIENE